MNQRVITHSLIRNKRQSFTRGSIINNKSTLTLMRKTAQIHYTKLPKEKCKSRYMNYRTDSLSKLSDSHLKSRKKIRRLLSKMEIIYNESKDEVHKPQLISKNKSMILQKGLPAVKNPLTNMKLSVAKTLSNDDVLEKVANNDSSYFRDNPLTLKQMFILGSMQTTFLCSNYCRFQPLLNVFN